MQIIISDTAEQLAQSAAKWIAEQIQAAVAERGICYMVLSGGKTPENIYRLLAMKPYKDVVPWQQVHFFWGDERMVPFNDEQNNAKMAFDALLDHLDIPPGNIHRMSSMEVPESAEIQYDELLHHYFRESDEFSFDIVLLGMGDDGHTLSLFPQTAVLTDLQHWVSAYFVEKVKQYRITLLPAIVNKARSLAFIVSGNSKSVAFEKVVKGKPDPVNFPAQLICPVNGELYWLIDSGVSGAAE